MRRGRDGVGKGAARGRAAPALLALLVVLLAGGCGRAKTGGPGDATSLTGAEMARRGNYKVRAVENGIDLGIGLYDDGSFRLLPEGRTLVAIFDQGSGKGWTYDLRERRSRPATREEAAALDNFMPATLLEQYFQLEQFWKGGEFRMATDDGRSFLIRMDGPDGLPSLFEVSDRRGVFRRIEWTYFKVGEVSRRNFSPPGGE
jgi:hypothetical protein